jgi:1,4-alpha-glucan branching enzyme
MVPTLRHPIHDRFMSGSGRLGPAQVGSGRLRPDPASQCAGCPLWRCFARQVWSAVVTSALAATDPGQAVPWWRSGVTYQVYIRSFADSDGDGMGDIEGIRSRLPYLVSLGVDAVWINPWYPSPQADGGYDVADYREIDPAFGTLDAAQRLIDDAHAAGLRVVLDIVPNHTSDEHPWFVAALAAAPGSAER